jgi:GMP synthase (glutamine-hydrolysing)
MSHQKVAVLDFGGQYAHLIAAKLRSMAVCAELVDSTTPAEELGGYAGLILSGSPSLASRGEGGDYDHAIFDLDVPILGLCFGHQEIAKRYGGEVAHTGSEFGPAVLHVDGSRCPLLRGLEERETVWMSHQDTVATLPAGFVELGHTMASDGRRQKNAAIGSEDLKRYGFQFHPEVDDTPGGAKMLANFAIEICSIEPSWTMESYAQTVEREIRKRAGDRSVLLLVSGGVDSTVCAWLLSRAVGPDKLHLLHIDNGLMRAGESEEVMGWLREHDVSHHLHFADASAEFLENLAGVYAPEEKRRIIGETFVDVLEREARRLDLDKFVMAQGTIYPDTIETGGSKKAEVIKTHHNRVPVVQEMIDSGKMLEPLADLYKSEVRKLGAELGVPARALARHPFPGPGLGVRCLASEGKWPDTHNEQLARQVRERAANSGFEGLLLPILSVGVKADLRSYEQPVLLWREGFDWEAARQAAVHLVNDIEGINRCVYLWGEKPKGEIFPVAAEVTGRRLAILRRADDLVHRGLRDRRLLDSIWQCPVVSVPVAVGGDQSELIVIRPVYSERAMTAQPAPLPSDFVEEMAEEITSLGTVWGVCVDVTAKPPGTIEWE